MMKKAINEFSHIIENHFDTHNDKDVSIIVDTRDMLEIVKRSNFARYDEVSVSYEGEYHIVSSCVVGDTTRFYVEDVRNEYGLKYDETNVLFIPNYLPQEIRDHFVNQGGYDKLIELNEDSVYEDLANKFEN